jgi:hypothetical protein
MLKRADDLSPGDPLVTPDNRRWRVAAVDRVHYPPMFMATDDSGTTVLSAGLERVAWSPAHQCWILVESRREPRV